MFLFFFISFWKAFLNNANPIFLFCKINKIFANIIKNKISKFFFFYNWKKINLFNNKGYLWIFSIKDWIVWLPDSVRHIPPISSFIKVKKESKFSYFNCLNKTDNKEAPYILLYISFKLYFICWNNISLANSLSIKIFSCKNLLPDWVLAKFTYRFIFLNPNILFQLTRRPLTRQNS